jgi:hypothetical protein
MSYGMMIYDACFDCVKQCLANNIVHYLVVVEFDPVYESKGLAKP